MIIDKFSSFFTDTPKCVKCPTSRIDCETNFLSILENFFQSGCIFGGKSISAIAEVPSGRGGPASHDSHPDTYVTLCGTMKVRL